MKSARLACSIVALATLTVPAAAQQAHDWQSHLADRLAQYGHRNWIVVADAAYPAQTSPGIETIVVDAELPDVLEVVLYGIGKAKHVSPAILLDAELPLVEERDARGITSYRAKLKKLLGKRETQSLAHEQIIDKLDKAGDKFRVLILKTNTLLPYSSVFMQLDCGYWDASAEKRLREKMAEAEKKQ